MSDASRERITATLIAGGASRADVQRYFELYDDPNPDAALREALDLRTVIRLSVVNVLITIGRKPPASS